MCTDMILQILQCTILHVDCYIKVKDFNILIRLRSEPCFELLCTRYQDTGVFSFTSLEVIRKDSELYCVVKQ